MKKIIIPAAALAASTAGLIRYTFHRKPSPDETKPSLGHPALAPFEDRIFEEMEWLKEQQMEELTITSHDGLRLKGHYLKAENPRACVILVHGYTSSYTMNFPTLYRFYHEQEISILAIEQRAHGASEGRWMTFGAKESMDLRQWISLLRESDSTPVILHGISMGATTVMMSLGKDTPDYIKSAVLDCGFTCSYDQFTYMLSKKKLPVKALMSYMRWVVKLFPGYDLKRPSTADCLKESHVPALFIHGEKDTFVPMEFTMKNYEACVADKRLLTIPKARHGQSFLVEEKKCQEALIEFIETYI